MTHLVAAAVAFVLSLILPVLLKPILLRLGVLDIPNERSSHTEAVVRGMGITVAAGVAGGLLAAMLLGSGQGVPVLAALGGAALAAALLGWVEDFRGLGILARFLLQLGIGAAATAMLVRLADSTWWWVPLGAIAIAGYINVANFMDGVNGISGLHGLAAGGLFAVAGGMTGLAWLVSAGVVVAAAFAAFLPWNFSGRNFLGDVGSYLLGGSLAVTGVAAFLHGVHPEMLLGPVAVYLADTMTTLLRRISAGERWYTPHRQHVYQRLTDAGLSHLQSALVVTVCSVLTGICGLIAAEGTLPVKAAALAAGVAVLVFYLRSPRIFRRLQERSTA
ncbi:undecaprenyl-phosphate alpha-N-acetyl-D-fucosaminephosphotransferase [Arthrobacter crystallopoietes BAB-32]|uniref:Undecaprenyl-phosphate alpha-N-acetyl-D-fucosaminephosphotransferase n=1 Tax=Arthrobacter crystallopoietes BAB-32 TaxID=1246476 RepID=N1V8S1_9MICC|nr:glycosyltransferase family 4 protein [Arthrobacter crystallopoietes]EMY34648.1 undecaprenyl-phosphate alpha-N-acetyl-D-fucosaminephosphotransferase [Arthrobacter crystallopoietes BAB-32]